MPIETIERWTCERCALVTFGPPDDESYIPPGWFFVSGGKLIDGPLCPHCAEQLTLWLTSGTP